MYTSKNRKIREKLRGSNIGISILSCCWQMKNALAVNFILALYRWLFFFFLFDVRGARNNSFQWRSDGCGSAKVYFTLTSRTTGQEKKRILLLYVLLEIHLSSFTPSRRVLVFKCCFHLCCSREQQQAHHHLQILCTTTSIAETILK